MFLDRHFLPGMSPEELADAHCLDVALQDHYGVRYHAYWFDPDSGSVFCLAEGPDRDALETVHREAHGAVASSIIEIDPNAPLNLLLGAPPSFPVGTAYAAPALRTILFTDVCGSVEHTTRLGDDAHVALLREHNRIVRDLLGRHDGREVKHTGDGIMASFSSVANAVLFAIEVQRALHARNRDAEPQLHVSIGLNAGEPVTDDNEDLFGAAVQLAARLCDAAKPGQILASLVVRELCLGKPFRFEDGGRLALKGLPEPAPAYVVPWHDEHTN
jgi:class 3 adenylate cyclase